MADEVTDSSNREQFAVCLRWVDHDLVTHQELVGLYAVDNITSETLVNSLKDVLLRMGLSVQNCRGQPTARTIWLVLNLAQQHKSKKKEPLAILTHCYGHFLQLAVGDMVRKVRNLRDALDTTSEISKLLKYLPKRDRMFEKLTAESAAPETPGFRVLCPTRWTVREASLQSVIDNWILLQELWDEKLGDEFGVRSQVESNWSQTSNGNI